MVKNLRYLKNSKDKGQLVRLRTQLGLASTTSSVP